MRKTDGMFRFQEADSRGDSKDDKKKRKSKEEDGDDDMGGYGNSASGNSAGGASRWNASYNGHSPPEVNAVQNYVPGRVYLFIGRSMMDTCRVLILLEQMKEADKLMSEFSIPLKRFWRCKISALTESQNVTELVNVAKNRNSPFAASPNGGILKLCPNEVIRNSN
jgi:hypothetical protein